MLLNATLRGGYATRGAYTKALSDAFKLADGSHDIHTLHCMAQSIMGEHQTPEFRSSLRKRLYLNSNGVLFFNPIYKITIHRGFVGVHNTINDCLILGALWETGKKPTS